MRKQQFKAFLNKMNSKVKSILDEKKYGIALFVLLLLISAGAIAFVSYQKTMPGYDATPLKESLSGIDKFSQGLTAIIALAMLVISAAAYKRIPDKKFMLVMLAFAVFALKAVLKFADRYFVPGYLVIDSIESLMDLGVLALLFLALFRK